MSESVKSPRRKVPAPRIAKPSSVGATVTIGSKLPHNLVLRLHGMRDEPEIVHGGATRIVQRSYVIGEPVIINGNAHAANISPAHRIVGGYALTHGVSADFWEAWLRQNHDADVVRNNLVFSARATHAEGRAKEQAAIISGFEGLDQDNPGRRVPKVQKGAK